MGMDMSGVSNLTSFEAYDQAPAQLARDPSDYISTPENTVAQTLLNDSEISDVEFNPTTLRGPAPTYEYTFNLTAQIDNESKAFEGRLAYTHKPNIYENFNIELTNKDDASEKYTLRGVDFSKTQEDMGDRDENPQVVELGRKIIDSLER